MSSDVENQDIVDDLQNGNKSPPVLSPVKNFDDDFQNEDPNPPVLSPVKSDRTPPPSPHVTEGINPPDAAYEDQNQAVLSPVKGDSTPSPTNKTCAP